MNQASNDVEDAFTAADVGTKLESGDILQMNAALTTLAQQMIGYQQRVGEMTPPLEVPDLAALKAAELRSVATFQEVLQELRLGIQAGSEARIAQAAQRLVQLDLDPDFKKPLELQQAILARFNIPDAEVSFRRPPP
jgi:hypothetical protein